jgi:hypothetical protein
MKWEDPPAPGARIVQPGDIASLKQQSGRWALLVERGKKFTIHTLRDAYPGIEFVCRKVEGRFRLYGRAIAPKPPLGTERDSDLVMLPGQREDNERIAAGGPVVPPLRSASPIRSVLRAPLGASDFRQALLDVLRDSDAPMTISSLHDVLEQGGWRGTKSTGLRQRVHNSMISLSRRGQVEQLRSDSDAANRWQAST